MSLCLSHKHYLGEDGFRWVHNTASIQFGVTARLDAAGGRDAVLSRLSYHSNLCGSLLVGAVEVAVNPVSWALGTTTLQLWGRSVVVL